MANSRLPTPLLMHAACQSRGFRGPGETGSRKRLANKILGSQRSSQTSPATGGATAGGRPWVYGFATCDTVRAGDGEGWEGMRDGMMRDEGQEAIEGCRGRQASLIPDPSSFRPTRSASRRRSCRIGSAPEWPRHKPDESGRRRQMCGPGPTTLFGGGGSWSAGHQWLETRRGGG
jgi:hypothetical protein